VTRAAAGFGAVGAAALAGCVVSAMVDPRHTLVAWIAGYWFALSSVLSTLALVMVIVVARATWWAALRPIALAICGATPVFVGLFVPVAVAARSVFPASAASANRETWSEPHFWLVRAVLYLAVWCVLAGLLRRADAAYTRAPSAAALRRLRAIAGAGLPPLAFTLHWAGVDGIESLDPRLGLDMLGVYLFAGGLTAALGAMAIAATRDPGVTPEHLAVVGRLMLMSVILWAYVAYFQMMLVWIADVPRESMPFLGMRALGAFGAMDVALVALHFAAPLLVLLPRASKRSRVALSATGGWLVAMHGLDVAWLVLGTSGRVSPLDVLPLLSCGALAAAAALSRVPSRVHPELARALAYEAAAS
jgi:hypothetical protein